MMNERIEKALNEQMNAELYSAYLYLSMASYFESKGLEGCAHWMKAQTQEELMHAMKFYEFITERGGRAIMKAIDAPPSDWDSPLNVFENALQHEQYVTSLINKLMDLAIEEKDHATQIFLQWFISEQVEEEATAGAVVEKMRLAGESPGGVFMVDRELAQRQMPIPIPQTKE
ncbi:Ferritin-like protein [Dissulfuribacter thermophilus]|uniref:Ferritin n=1 Tax=Dissulfuribacter thermophilus TaxID=1156395 RepID=A0A1B9F3X9_9BACT|nr:ferritin [Dissulfuribacter thermophilus]OCC14630.1 Ferritin-like protein [Dissulfuribacter thermophilus]